MKIQNISFIEQKMSIVNSIEHTRGPISFHRLHHSLNLSLGFSSTFPPTFAGVSLLSLVDAASCANSYPGCPIDVLLVIWHYINHQCADVSGLSYRCEQCEILHCRVVKCRVDVEGFH